MLSAQSSTQQSNMVEPHVTHKFYVDFIAWRDVPENEDWTESILPHHRALWWGKLTGSHIIEEESGYLVRLEQSEPDLHSRGVSAGWFWEKTRERANLPVTPIAERSVKRVYRAFYMDTQLRFVTFPPAKSLGMDVDMTRDGRVLIVVHVEPEMAAFNSGKIAKGDVLVMFMNVAVDHIDAHSFVRQLYGRRDPNLPITCAFIRPARGVEQYVPNLATVDENDGDAPLFAVRGRVAPVWINSPKSNRKDVSLVDQDQATETVQEESNISPTRPRIVIPTVAADATVTKLRTRASSVRRRRRPGDIAASQHVEPPPDAHPRRGRIDGLLAETRKRSTSLSGADVASRALMEMEGLNIRNDGDADPGVPGQSRPPVPPRQTPPTGAAALATLDLPMTPTRQRRQSVDNTQLTPSTRRRQEFQANPFMDESHDPAVAVADVQPMQPVQAAANTTATTTTNAIDDDPFADFDDLLRDRAASFRQFSSTVSQKLSDSQGGVTSGQPRLLD